MSTNFKFALEHKLLGQQIHLKYLNGSKAPKAFEKQVSLSGQGIDRTKKNYVLWIKYLDDLQSSKIQLAYCKTASDQIYVNKIAGGKFCIFGKSFKLRSPSIG